MSLAEQTAWCETAASLLSHSILLPPVGSTAGEEEFCKDILPHEDHLRQCRTSLERHRREKRFARMKSWPVLENGFDIEKALMYVKFSVIYMYNGRWEDARKLQVPVREFAMQSWGMRHTSTRAITRTLAHTLTWLDQMSDAAVLQAEVLDASNIYLGSDDHDTLSAKIDLGNTRFFQDRADEAKEL
jgi:hypothetical protein